MVDFLGSRVEMRSDPDAGAGPIVDDDAAADELFGDVGTIGYVDDDRAPALAIVFWRIEPEARLAGKIHQAARQHQRFRTDRVDANLPDDFITGAACIQRRHVGCAALEPLWSGGKVQRA